MLSPPPNVPPPLPIEATGAADALIEVLHRLQERQGWLDRETLRQVARQLRLPLSHVVGVASFYHLFLLQRPTPHRCAVCLGSACFVRGALELAQALSDRLGVELDDSRGNGAWSLQRVGCLGACGQAPVLVVDAQLLTRMPVGPTALTRLEDRLDEAGLPRSGRGPMQPAGPCPLPEPHS